MFRDGIMEIILTLNQYWQFYIPLSTTAFRICNFDICMRVTHYS